MNQMHRVAQAGEGTARSQPRKVGGGGGGGKDEKGGRVFLDCWSGGLWGTPAKYRHFDFKKFGQNGQKWLFLTKFDVSRLQCNLTISSHIVVIYLVFWSR